MSTNNKKKDPQICYHISQTNVVLLLAFIGGYVDAAGYIKLHGVFTSSITGNLVAACSLITYHQPGVLCRLLVCIFFAVGGML